MKHKLFLLIAIASLAGVLAMFANSLWAVIALVAFVLIIYAARKIMRPIWGVFSLLLGCAVLFFTVFPRILYTGYLTSLPDYDYLPEIRELQSKGKLAEAERLADYVIEGSEITNKTEIVALRAEIHKERTAFVNRVLHFLRGLATGEGNSAEELFGAIVSDFLAYGDFRDLVKQGYYKVTDKETDPVVAVLASVGAATSVLTLVPTGGEAAEASADVSLSFMKLCRKAGVITKKFGDFILDRGKKIVKTGKVDAESMDAFKGMKSIIENQSLGQSISLMRHVENVGDIKAIAKLSKEAPVPLAVFLGKEGPDKMRVVHKLAEASDGVSFLNKAARKGARGFDILTSRSLWKPLALLKSWCNGHLSALVQLVLLALLLALIKVKLIAFILSAILIAYGIYASRLYRLIRWIYRRRRENKILQQNS